MTSCTFNLGSTGYGLLGTIRDYYVCVELGTWLSEAGQAPFSRGAHWPAPIASPSSMVLHGPWSLLLSPKRQRPRYKPTTTPPPLPPSPDLAPPVFFPLLHFLFIPRSLIHTFALGFQYSSPTLLLSLLDTPSTYTSIHHVVRLRPVFRSQGGP